MTIQLDEIKTEIGLTCPCGKLAKLIALRHLINACDGPFAETPDGDEIHPVCVDCARLLHQSVARDIEDRISGLPEGWTLKCATCARPVTAIHSVLEWVLI